MTALTALYNLPHDMLLAWLRKRLGLGNEGHLNPNRLRRDAAAQRVRMYRDNGRADFERIVNTVFETADVRRERKEMIDVASEQNVPARIVNEVASLYDQPAMRRYLDAADDKRWRDLSEQLEFDDVMQEAHRLCFLCNEVLLWASRIDGVLDLDIVTPDAFDVIPHPLSHRIEAGVLLDVAPAMIGEGGNHRSVKHYELWDDTFRYDLNCDGELVGPVVEHGLGMIPGVLMHRRRPVDCLLDTHSGFDMISAGLGVGLLNIMIMRLAKSQGERQPALQGNLAKVAAGQSMNGEKPLLLPPDVVAFMLDTKTEPGHYLEAKRDKLTSVAVRYGMSYDQLINADAAESASGKAWSARRLKLNELRAEQRRRARVHERLIATLLGFNPTMLRVDFAEVMAPADKAERLDILDREIKMGLSSPIRYLMSENPSLTRAEAISLIRDNTRDNGIVIEMLRSLNAPRDAMQGDPGASAQDNGAQGGRPPVDQVDPADAGDVADGAVAVS